MRLRYENTFDDLLAFQEHHHANSPAVRRQLALVRWGCALAAFSILSLIAWDRRDWSFAVGGLVAAAFLLVVLPPAMRRTLRVQAAIAYREVSNKGVIGPHELELVDDGLVERSATGEQRIRWDGIERIASTDRHTLIYVGSLMAHVIPHERVTEGDPQAFVRELERRRASGTA